MSTTEARRIDWRIVALGAAPLVWLALFYAFVVRARFHLGRWPEPYAPDPKTLEFTLHHAAVFFGFLGVLIGCAGAVAVALVQYARGLRRFPWSVIITVAVGLMGLVAYCQLDPGSYLVWFMD
jgi:hypothetical protein